VSKNRADHGWAEVNVSFVDDTAVVAR